jgi:hypothetical protein
MFAAATTSIIRETTAETKPAIRKQRAATPAL